MKNNITNIIVEEIHKLYEDPDNVYTLKNNQKINVAFDDDDAISFGYLGDSLIVGNNTHFDAIKYSILNGSYTNEYIEYNKRKIFNDPKINDDNKIIEYENFVRRYASELRTYEMTYDGRLWTNDKVISFWNYPENKIILFRILKNIEQNLNINITNNNYYIEVIIINDNDWTDDKSTLIPIDDYESKFFTKIPNKPHEMSDYEWSKRGGKRPVPYNTIYHNSKKEKGTLSKSAAEYNFKTQKGIAENDDYRGEHQAPNRDDSPMYDVTNDYGNDFYDSLEKSVRYYGDGTNYDDFSVGLIQSVHNKPNTKIKIYRAVPLVITNQEKIEMLEKHKKYILKTGRLPYGVDNWNDKSEYYDFISDKLEKLKELPLDGKVKINSGDWVTINPAYAKEHGITHLNNKYRILTKTVFAKNLFTDGNSIHEWGYVE